MVQEGMRGEDHRRNFHRVSRAAVGLEGHKLRSRGRKNTVKNSL
jgi:hypothetical protein